MKFVKLTSKNIEKLIERWKQSDSKLEIHEYIGITLQQYAHWVATRNLDTEYQKDLNEKETDDVNAKDDFISEIKRVSNKFNLDITSEEIEDLYHHHKR
jgi:hypothetical protein